METVAKQKRLVDTILAEINQEAETTKKLLDIIPEDKLSWRPHEKARSLGELAMHIATTQGNFAKVTQADSAEVNPPTEREAANRTEILEAFADSLKTANDIIGATDDARVMSEWTLTKDGQIIVAMLRGDFWRFAMLNHYYHHRGQLSVYLRQLGEKIPSIYGPSADAK